MINQQTQQKLKRLWMSRALLAGSIILSLSFLTSRLHAVQDYRLPDPKWVHQISEAVEDWENPTTSKEAQEKALEQVFKLAQQHKLSLKGTLTSSLSTLLIEDLKQELNQVESQEKHLVDVRKQHRKELQRQKQSYKSNVEKALEQVQKLIVARRQEAHVLQTQKQEIKRGLRKKLTYDFYPGIEQGLRLDLIEALEHTKAGEQVFLEKLVQRFQQSLAQEALDTKTVTDILEEASEWAETWSKEAELSKAQSQLSKLRLAMAIKPPTEQNDKRFKEEETLRKKILKLKKMQPAWLRELASALEIDLAQPRALEQQLKQKLEDALDQVKQLEKELKQETVQEQALIASQAQIATLKAKVKKVQKLEEIPNPEQVLVRLLVDKRTPQYVITLRRSIGYELAHKYGQKLKSKEEIKLSLVYTQKSYQEIVLLACSVVIFLTLVILLVRQQKQTSIYLTNQFICFLPEEYIAELGALRERLIQEKRAHWLIRLILLKCIAETLWAFYIQITIENTWLPNKANARRIDK